MVHYIRRVRRGNEMKKIGFIGAGNMAYAMAGALYEANPTTSIGIFDIDNNRIEVFKNSFSSTVVYNSINEVAEKSDIVVVAVKPQVFDSVLNELSDYNKIVVSIAAGITLDRLVQKVPHGGVVRVMPNAPSLVGKMAAGVSFSNTVKDSQKRDVLEFLSYSGLALEVEESDMDAVTGVSGSGPAFVARIMEKFIKAGVKQGLDERTSKALTINTFLGTAQLLLEKNMEIEELVKMVSSPGGTTIAGRKVLESSELESIIDKTVDATVKRSKELGK